MTPLTKAEQLGDALVMLILAFESIDKKS